MANHGKHVQATFLESEENWVISDYKGFTNFPHPHHCKLKLPLPQRYQRIACGYITLLPSRTAVLIKMLIDAVAIYFMLT
ncbi:hypothetical protein TNCV_4095761 [Trichonephila clavipes]|uniref:Uncharacterized protein n=1 Tax=Trichonephila clavipes TaxID=2585209 RepID=A0A8X6S724_TRICX|nr:hypothetical protein TNCV_4095761 [Trichonephila clavipes]